MTSKTKKARLTEERSVTALSYQAGSVRAVTLRRTATGFELVAKSSSPGGFDAAGSQASHETNGLVVTGFDSSSLLFCRLEMPTAKRSELDRMISLQAEARLPVPADQLELTWRLDRSRAGHVPVTVAAGRKQQLERYLATVRDVKPESIYLDSEAIVEAWFNFFDGEKKESILLDISDSDTKVCVADGRRLTNSATIDIGLDELSLPHESEASGRFAQDLTAVLRLFGVETPDSTDVTILSDGRAAFAKVAEMLSAQGLNAACCEPTLANISLGDATGDRGVLYEYRTCIGLASLALQTDATERLNIFQHLYLPQGKAEGARPWWNLKFTIPFSIAMLLICLGAWYLVDLANLKTVKDCLNGSDQGTSCHELVQKNRLVKTLSRQRPDLLGLLAKINNGQEAKVTLDSFEFTMQRPVTIRGVCQGAEQLYKFQENLIDKAGISDVKIQSTAKAKKGGKLNFTITFHYRPYTQGKKMSGLL